MLRMYFILIPCTGEDRPLRQLASSQLRYPEHEFDSRRKQVFRKNEEGRSFTLGNLVQVSSKKHACGTWAIFFRSPGAKFS